MRVPCAVPCAVQNSLIISGRTQSCFTQNSLIQRNSKIWCNLVSVCILPLPLGMSNGQLSNSHVSASTEHARYRAWHGRLDTYGAWCAAMLDNNQWLQIDLGEVKEVMAVSLQGRMNDSWITTFYLQYSTDMVTWYCYGTQALSKVHHQFTQF